MLKLIPRVKYIEEKCEYLPVKAISRFNVNIDQRVKNAIEKLPFDKKGIPLEIVIDGESGEAYEIDISREKISVTSSTSKGAFYAVQTLRQIFNHSKVPLVYIKDFPDLAYRGYYQDVTRGRIPKVETLKKFIDTLAFLKYNAFQIYIEHVFEFEQYKEINEKTGFYTADEIRELDAYCYENFIEFQPSLSCFGHLYELLNLEKYKHLRCKKDYAFSGNRWADRQRHHTLNPTIAESFELITSMIDAYYPLFKSDTFNICCDETFDLKELEKEGFSATELYVEFVTKLVNHLKSKGKKVMMWADFSRKHPELLDRFPEGVTFINWNYDQSVKEELFSVFENAKHIVAPSVCSQLRFCEAHHYLVPIIKKIVAYGYKYGAEGVLNTNWGDWGNPASLEMSLWGVAFGSAVAWDVDTDDGDLLHSAVNLHIYKHSTGYQICEKINEMHRPLYWHEFVKNVIRAYNKEEIETQISELDIGYAQRMYKNIMAEIPYDGSDLSEEMQITAQGICLMYEYIGLMAGYSIKRITSTEMWLEKYKKKWLEKNKESELANIIRVFEWLELNY